CGRPLAGPRGGGDAAEDRRGARARQGHDRLRGGVPWHRCRRRVGVPDSRERGRDGRQRRPAARRSPGPRDARRTSQGPRAAPPLLRTRRGSAPRLDPGAIVMTMMRLNDHGGLACTGLTWSLLTLVVVLWVGAPAIALIRRGGWRA